MAQATSSSDAVVEAILSTRLTNFLRRFQLPLDRQYNFYGNWQCNVEAAKLSSAALHVTSKNQHNFYVELELIYEPAASRLVKVFLPTNVYASVSQVVKAFNKSFEKSLSAHYPNFAAIINNKNDFMAAHKNITADQYSVYTVVGEAATSAARLNDRVVAQAHAKMVALQFHIDEDGFLQNQAVIARTSLLAKEIVEQFTNQKPLNFNRIPLPVVRMSPRLVHMFGFTHTNIDDGVPEIVEHNGNRTLLIEKGHARVSLFDYSEQSLLLCCNAVTSTIVNDRREPVLMYLNVQNLLQDELPEGATPRPFGSKIVSFEHHIPRQLTLTSFSSLEFAFELVDPTANVDEFLQEVFGNILDIEIRIVFMLKGDR